MLKLGSNLLQAIGSFNGKLRSNSKFKHLVFTILVFRIYIPKRAFNLCLGHYVLAVAITGTAPSPNSSVLQDHVQPVVSTLDSGTATNHEGQVETSFVLCFVLNLFIIIIRHSIRMVCLKCIHISLCYSSER